MTGGRNQTLFLAGIAAKPYLALYATPAEPFHPFLLFRHSRMLVKEPPEDYFQTEKIL
jgi:hypothetical protein